MIDTLVRGAIQEFTPRPRRICMGLNLSRGDELPLAFSRADRELISNLTRYDSSTLHIHLGGGGDAPIRA